MTATTAPQQQSARQVTRQRIGLLSVAALAWAGVIAFARNMGNGAGTMDMPVGEFMAMWTLMMTAMMLPAVAPVATLYARTVTSNRVRRLLLFVGGYLLVWSAVGLPAYVALRIVDDHAAAPSTLRIVAVVILGAAGIYQLTPLKTICLRHCRSPLGQLLHYGNMKGRGRDLRVALHHAGFCLGCCWALMALFVAFGIMNLWAMLGLAALVASEKLSRHGETIGRAAGALLIALAFLVALSPSVATAVVPTPSMSTMTDM